MRTDREPVTRDQVEEIRKEQLRASMAELGVNDQTPDRVERAHLWDKRHLLTFIDQQDKRIEELEGFRELTVDLTQEKYAAEAKVEKLEEELSDAKHEADHWKHTISWMT